jgi:hypothetical protein
MKHQLSEVICKGFIHSIPRYNKQWDEVTEFCNNYNRPIPTYKSHFIQNTHIGIFWNDKLDFNFFGKLWMYIGMKFGYLKSYIKQHNISMNKSKQILEDCFTPELRKMMENNLET